jgi:hypothetical protein
VNPSRHDVDLHLDERLSHEQRQVLRRMPEARRLVWTAHEIGLSQCLACSRNMANRVAASTEAMMELARLAHATDLALEKPSAYHDGLPHRLDEAALRDDLYQASAMQRRDMAVQALHMLAHDLPAARRKATQWKTELDTATDPTTG